MKKNMFILLFIGSLLVSCKKKEPVASPTSLFITNSPYVATNATVFSGAFSSATYTQVLSASNVQSGKTHIAFFSKIPTVNNDLATNMPVNDVLVNGQKMPFLPDLICYTMDLPAVIDKEVWQVNGANGIPSFNYTNTNPPAWTDFSIPDIIGKSTGFTIHINGVVNAPIASVYILDGSNSSLGQVSKPLMPGNNTITFSPADLSGLSTSLVGITFSLENNKSLNFFGKNFRFNQQAFYYKSIKIIP